MSQSVTFGDLKTKIRNRGDIYADYVGNSELETMVNDSRRELYRMIVGVNPEWYMSVTPDAISVVSGTSQYALPADFFLALGVDVKDTANRWFNLKPFNWGERNILQETGSSKYWAMYRIMGTKLIFVPTPSWSGDARLWYVPTLSDLSDDSDTWDTVSGFDEWVVSDVCVKFCAKEESDGTQFAMQREKTWDWILSLISKRDVAETDRVRDTSVERYGDGYQPTYWRP